MTAPSPREALRAALAAATQRPAARAPDAALHTLLDLTAGYFLGEWLEPHAHLALVRRLAGRLDGLADLRPPPDPVHATQLAQHVRELTADLGPSPWAAALAQATRHLVPARPEDWQASLVAATGLARAGDPHPLLVAHARHRLWELAHPAPGAAPTASNPQWLAHEAARADGHALQLAEAMLAEGLEPSGVEGGRGGLGRASSV